MVLSPIPEIPTETSATTLPPPLSATSIILILQQQSTPIPTPPITTIALVVTTIPDPLPVIIQRVSVLEKDIQELKEVDHTTTLLALLRSEIQLAVNAYLGSDVIKESVQENFINEVKNLLPKFLPRVVSDFATLVIQSTVKKALEKTPIVLAQSSSQAQSSLKAVESLSEYELKRFSMKRWTKVAPKILRKRDHDDDNKDEDPSTGPDQEELVEEPAFEMASDDTKQTVDDVVNDAERPQEDATQTKDKALKKDWFKQPPRSQINKFSKHNVYSTQKILSVASVTVEKLHGYGYLKEIMVRRADRQKYTFKEGSDIVDLAMALRIFTKSSKEESRMSRLV
nr:hypothetical protein [Tanacetum cinerariifolium]